MVGMGGRKVTEFFMFGDWYGLNFQRIASSAGSQTAQLMGPRGPKGPMAPLAPMAPMGPMGPMGPWAQDHHRKKPSLERL